MTGGTKSTTTQEANYSPEQRRLQAVQAGVASSVAPGIEDVITSVLGGNPLKSTGYAQSLAGPTENATQRAIEGILARTPRGGMQTQLMEQARLQGGLQQAQTQQDYIKQALQMAMAVFGYQGQPLGQTTTQTGSSGPRIGINAGPLSLAF